MTKTYDSGSLPFREGIDEKKFSEGASLYNSNPSHESAKYFEKTIIDTLVDKAKAGLDIPNYPEFRDIDQMFLSLVEGVEKTKEGYVPLDKITMRKENTITPEITAIRKNSQKIGQTIGEPFRVRMCLGGPHILSSFFIYKNSEIYDQMAEILCQMIENDFFNEKHAGISLISIEEPLIGLLDDPLITYGSEGREKLLNAWETVLGKAKAKGAQTILHLHKTSDEIFWQTKSLNIIEAPVDDPLYQMQRTKQLLDETDKTLMASVCTVDFDKLIKQKIFETKGEANTSTVGEQTAEAWKNIKSGKLRPETFLESIEVMKRRLAKIVERFGKERVPFAGPECGMKGFPSYDCAMECLRRVSVAAKNI